MRLSMPNWEFANLAKQGYEEDGVRGEVGYDSEKGEWYVDLNNEDQEKYLENICNRVSEVLRTYCREPKWGDAVNVQGQLQVPPKENQNRLSLYLVDMDCQTTRGFKVNATLSDVFNRRSAGMFFGSTCESCGRKMLVVLEWEDVKPKGGDV